MENFILYEEIGKGQHSTVYKGRRKGTIKFLSILCIEKEKRSAVTNWVRLVHEVEHDHIVKFFEWYETTNHLWMVTELCTGGTLDLILQQDTFLPESTIRSFGRDVLSGLFYLHTNGVIFGDLSPKRILFDGPGTLKLTNFCLSRLVDENLSDVYTQASGQNKPFEGDFNGPVEYQAPEIKAGGEVTMASDVWSFGVILYLMYTGAFPLENPGDLYNKRKETSTTKSIVDKSKVSHDFQDLVCFVLNKDVNERPTVEEIMHHPFWQDTIDMHEEKNLSASNLNTSRLSASFSLNASKSNTTANAVSTAGPGGDNSMKNKPETVMDSTFTLSSRPHTANTAQPTTSNLNDDPVKEVLQSFNKLSTKDSLGVTYIADDKKDAKTNNSVSNLGIDKSKNILNSSLDEIDDFVYHQTDLDIDLIQDNPHIKKNEVLRWDSKQLPFKPLTDFEKLTADEISNHVKQVENVFNQSSGTSQNRLKSSALSYLCHVCLSSSVASHQVINSTFLQCLAVLVKNNMQQSQDVSCKAARSIGLASSFCQKLESSTKILEVFSTLSDAMRENFRNIKAKQFVLPCLGQLLLLVAKNDTRPDTTSQQRPSTTKSQWPIPAVVFNLIIRCLKEGEDTVVQNYACKSIQSVGNTSSALGRRFISVSSSGASASSHSNEVIGPMLWSVCERSTSENLKHASLSALVCLNKLSQTGSVLQAIIDRVGLNQFFSVIQRFSYKCQQAILTAFVETLNSTPKGQAVRISNSKETLPSLMKFFENPSSVVRAKVLLCVFLLLKRKPSLLVSACNNRLIMYIERDCRRISTPSSGTAPKTPGNYDYIHNCLNFLVRYMIDQAPKISASCVAVLNEATGRKHPSQAQAKQMKAVLPSCSVLYHMVASQVFRNHVTNDLFIKHIGELLSHVSMSVQKASGLSSAVGDTETQKFIDSVLSTVECLSQHSIVLTKYESSTMKYLLPQLITMLKSYSSADGQMVCLKLITEVLSNILKYHSINMESVSSARSSMRASSVRSYSRSASRRRELPDISGIQNVIKCELLPEIKNLVQSKDPLPAYSVRLLGILLEYWPSFCEVLNSCGLISTVLNLFDEMKSLTFNSVVQEITSVLNTVVCYSKDNIMAQVYKSNMINNLLQYVTDVSKQYANAQRKNLSDIAASSSQVLHHLLHLLKSMLERVTVAVKHALNSAETRKSVNRTEEAENLLVIHKPFTELQGILIRLLCDELVGEPSLACVSLLVQLFGGDHPDTMTKDNMDSFARLLRSNHHQRSQSKSPKRIVLKLLKRIVSLNDFHAEQLKSGEGEVLVGAITELRGEAEKSEENQLFQLANELLYYVK